MAQKEKSPITGLMWLVGVYYFLQGMGGNPGLHSQTLELFLKESLLLDPMGQASFLFVITVPWMIKPLYGMISDFLPIFGYRRASYFVLASVLSITAYVLVALLGYSYASVAVLLTMSAVGFAFSDVLCDAVMVEKGQPLNATDKLQSAQWAAISVSSIILMFCGGYIAQYLPLQKAVLLSLVFPVGVLLVTFFFLKEKKVASVGDSARNAWQGMKLAAKMPAIWGCATFIFIFYLCPSFGTALYNYQIDQLGFSQVNIGHIRTVESVAFLLGVLVFAKICKQLSEKVFLSGIVIIAAVTTGVYLFYCNLASAFIIGASTSFVGAMAFVGVLVIAARVCPRYAEGTVFALLMSVSNLGKGLANIIGGHLYEVVGYHWLVVISTVSVAATWFLLPLIRKKN